MRWLTLWRQPDRGAVALIVSVLVGSLTLVGIAALTVDVGSMSLERRLLQNGADAAAASAVIECATTNTCPDVTNPSDPKMVRLAELANLNATNDGATSVSRLDGEYAVCGVGPGLQPCEAVSGNQLRDCPAPDPPPTQFVRVYTQTKSDLGADTLLPSGFAEALTGSSAGTRHQACAAYAWGTPGSFRVQAPIAISLCDYEKMITTDGYADPPPYTDPIPSTVTSHETAIEVNLPGQRTDSNDCERWAGHILPGGFGFLDPDAGCSPPLSKGDWIKAKPGESVPNKCKPAFSQVLDRAVWDRPVIYIPVFDCVSDHSKDCPTPTRGDDTYFHIRGLAAFHLTGSNLPSYNTGPLTDTDRTACSGKCLFGWFTQATLEDTSGTITEETGYGVDIIKAVG